MVLLPRLARRKLPQVTRTTCYDVDSHSPVIMGIKGVSLIVILDTELHYLHYIRLYNKHLIPSKKKSPVLGRQRPYSHEAIIVKNARNSEALSTIACRFPSPSPRTTSPDALDALAGRKLRARARQPPFANKTHQAGIARSSLYI